MMPQWDVIMHVEDDENYSVLLRAALQQIGKQHRLLQFYGAGEAEAYLKGEGKYCDREKFPLPALALVDIKMPGKSGLELLKWIRSESAHRLLPVVILTSSDDLNDVGQAYRLGANAFVLKPGTVPQLKELLKSLEGFWVRHNVVADAA